MKVQTPIILPLVLGIIVFAAFAIIAITNPDLTPEPTQFKKFSSYQELQDYVKTATESFGDYGDFFGAQIMTTAVGDMRSVAAPLAGAAESADAAKGGEDFSATNIQVEGVDEADIVKNDGKYIYAVSGNKVFIVDAYPAEGASILSEIEPEGSVQEIFINGDKLILFGQKSYYYGGIREEMTIALPPGRYYSPEMFTKVYDITDRQNPVLVRDIVMNGSYYDSRMIGDYVYIVINSPIQRDHIIIPMVYENGIAIRSPTVFPGVYYFDNPDYSYRFTTIMSINTQNDNEEPNSEIYMMGYTNNLYVSQNNIYITYQKHFSPYIFYDKIIDEVILPITPAGVSSQIDAIRNKQISDAEKMNEVTEVFANYFNSLSEPGKESLMTQMQQRMETIQREIAKELEKTIIQKISISNGEIEYKAEGKVPGSLLNQFSMDQSGSFFRVATTTGGWGWGGQTEQANNIYVLDSGMNTVGKLEDLAPGERIYSVRFIGDRVYMVTFKKIDPLFVIDLSQPTNPTVLGKLKIPGYSDYLHPYDENHIIGIGKHTVEAESEFRDFAWYQGIKMAIFDVSDVENPIEKHKIIIGDRGTDSYALQDHKAFLFSKERNLLVIPILLAEISGDKEDLPPNTYGDYVYQGAYVYDISLENGFVLKGRVTHYESDEAFKKSGYYFRGDYSIQRSLYIDNILYTLSQKIIKMNSLADISEINKLAIG